MTPRERDQITAGRIHCIVFMLALFLAFALLSACTPTMTAAPEPRVVAVDVPRIVQVKCKDQRGPADEYPDADTKLAGIQDDDFEGLAKAFRVGRDRRDARLASDDVQIKACAGE